MNGMNPGYRGQRLEGPGGNGARAKAGCIARSEQLLQCWGAAGAADIMVRVCTRRMHSTSRVESGGWVGHTGVKVEGRVQRKGTGQNTEIYLTGEQKECKCARPR